MNIREMTVEDLEQVMKIENAIFSTPWSETGFFTYIIRADAIFLVAEEDGEILGYCGILLAADQGDITNVAVKEDKRGQHIGTALVEELIKRATKEGVTQSFLEVRQSNEAAIALYEKLGFTSYGVRKGYYSNPTEDGIVMSNKHSH